MIPLETPNKLFNKSSGVELLYYNIIITCCYRCVVYVDISVYFVIDIDNYNNNNDNKMLLQLIILPSSYFRFVLLAFQNSLWA